MLDTFAHRENIGIGGAHVVGDDDAAIDLKLGGLRQVNIRADADRQHHQVGGNKAPVGKLHAFGA